MSAIRKWATPITIGAFLVSGVTGVLMFFHLESGLNKTAHEWLSWALVGGVALHLAVNYRAFTIYFKRRQAVAVMAVFAMVLGLSFLPLAGAGGGSPVGGVLRAMAASDIQTVIALSGLETSEGLARLEGSGFSADASAQMADLTGGDKDRMMDVLGVLFVR